MSFIRLTSKTLSCTSCMTSCVDVTRVHYRPRAARGSMFQLKKSHCCHQDEVSSRGTILVLCYFQQTHTYTQVFLSLYVFLIRACLYFQFRLLWSSHLAPVAYLNRHTCTRHRFAKVKKMTFQSPPCTLDMHIHHFAV